MFSIQYPKVHKNIEFNKCFNIFGLQIIEGYR